MKHILGFLFFNTVNVKFKGVFKVQCSVVFGIYDCYESVIEMKCKY